MKRASHFHTVTLEISLKPFRRTDEAFVREVCAGVFEQWRPLLKARETISILIFAADGSEILDYSGDLDAPFEWCKYLGTANCPSQGQDDPPWRSLHERRVLYCEDPPVMTYRVLKRVVAAFKEEGVKAFPEVPVAVGAMKAADLDLLFVDMVTYATSATFGVLVRELTCPIVLVALQPLSAMPYAKATTFTQLVNDDFCAVPEFTGVAIRFGKPVADVIIGMRGDDASADAGIASWCRVAHALHDLRRARIGLMGHVLEAMYDMHVDPTAVTRTFGCHVAVCEPDEILGFYENRDEAAIAAKKCGDSE